MQTFIRLFVMFMLPIALVCVSVAILYFSLDGYTFSKAMNVGALTGVLFALPATFVVVTLYLIKEAIAPKKVKNVAPQKSHKASEVQKEPKMQMKKEPKVQMIQKPTDEVKKESKGTTKKPIIQTRDRVFKQMLLLDKELAFHLLQTIIQTLQSKNLTIEAPKNMITFSNQDGVIESKITSLTKHTSQILITAPSNPKQAQRILKLFKEQQHSLLNFG